MGNQTIFRKQHYFSGGIFGYKVWVTVDRIDRLNKHTIIEQFRGEAIGIKKKRYEPTEITIFVYEGRQPVHPADNWIADLVFEYDYNDD